MGLHNKEYKDIQSPLVEFQGVPGPGALTRWYIGHGQPWPAFAH